MGGTKPGTLIEIGVTPAAVGRSQAVTERNEIARRSETARTTGTARRNEEKRLATRMPIAVIAETSAIVATGEKRIAAIGVMSMSVESLATGQKGSFASGRGQTSDSKRVETLGFGITSVLVWPEVRQVQVAWSVRSQILDFLTPKFGAKSFKIEGQASHPECQVSQAMLKRVGASMSTCACREAWAFGSNSCKGLGTVSGSLFQSSYA